MEHLPTIHIAGDPPAPRPIRLIERWRVSWHGRRDARLGTADQSPDAEQSAPYLNTLRAEAAAGQQAVSSWLHQKVVPVDREAVRLLTVLEQFRRDPVTRPTATLTGVPPDGSDPRPAFRIPSWVVEARQAAEAQRAYQRRISEQHAAEQQLGQLGSMRHHLIETARAAATAHLSRYEQLVGLYRAALHRRYPDRARPADRTPPAVNPESWVHGDLPLLALDVDSEPARSYRWFLKEFATRTSATPHPLPVEVRRAG